MPAAKSLRSGGDFFLLLTFALMSAALLLSAFGASAALGGQLGRQGHQRGKRDGKRTKERDGAHCWLPRYSG